MILRSAAMLVAGSMFLTGCGTPSEVEGGGDVDPQILRDVTSATSMLPGSEVARAMRVNAFILGLAIVECDGEPPPLDMTSDRMAQDLFPDLELIREQGFNDEVDHREIAVETVESNCPDLAPDLPTHRKWRNVSYEWEILAEDIQARSGALAATKSDAERCLRDRTGLDIEEGDPTTYLRSVNAELAKRGTGNEDMMRYAGAYAECMAEYFEVMESELLERRPEFAERNRELLARYAAEIAAAGYVP